MQKNCRFEKCISKVHRFGLCNKHRKWVERGHMTLDLVMLNKVKERSSVPKKCKIKECDNSSRRKGFCVKHSSQFDRGSIDKFGERLKIKISYNNDFSCVVSNCRRKDKFTRGLCKIHYNQFYRGTIDENGFFTKKRRMTYSSETFCKVKKCNKRAKLLGFCKSHRNSYKLGIYNESGKRLVPENTVNVGKKCTEENCVEAAVCKEMCRLHYTRKREGYLGPEAYKNVGKKCSEENCNKNAVARTLCYKHYRSLLKIEKNQTVQELNI
jgi:hypothetical protein